MKRSFFIMAATVLLYSCSNSSPNVSDNKDTVAPQNSGPSTPDNPGGLKATGGGTTNGNNMGGTDTSTKRINASHRDSTQ